jgi:hypothetical protein
VSEHPDIEELAAHADGQVPVGDPGVAGHVRGCPDCQELVTALARTRADLDRVAEPLLPAMPPEVAARLATRLTAEVTGPVETSGPRDSASPAGEAGPAAADRPTPAGARPPGRPLRPSARQRRTDRARRHRLLGAPWASAAVVVLVVAAVVGIAISATRHPGTSSASSAVASPASGGATHDRASANQPAASPVGTSATGHTPTVARPSGPTHYLSTNANYTPATLGVGALRLLDRYAAGSASPAAAHLDAAQRRCVAAYYLVPGRPAQVVDRARWNGRRAIVIIVPGSGTSEVADVVTLSCELLKLARVSP